MTNFETKLQAAKDALGSRYLCHPDNMVKKKRQKKTTFQKLVEKNRKKMF